jgi:hypothetical protein
MIESVGVVFVSDIDVYRTSDTLLIRSVGASEHKTKYTTIWYYYLKLKCTYEYNYAYEWTLWLEQSPRHRT